jgi:hypothetical protein
MDPKKAVFKFVEVAPRDGYMKKLWVYIDRKDILIIAGGWRYREDFC